MNAPVSQAESSAVAIVTRPGQFDLSPQTFEQALTFANYLADSDMVPKDFKGKPANCLIGMQWGMELGMKPLQAIQNIAVINGRPNLWGDAMLALVRSSPLCEYVTEDWHPDGTAFCKAKRRGEPEQIRTFSDADAKLAGLLGKQGPWSTGPKRMGMAEEALDTVAMTTEPRNMGMADVVQTEKAATALPLCSDEQFAVDLPIYKKAISRGKKTVEDVLTTVATAFSLSQDQIDAIKAIPAELAKAAGERKPERTGPATSGGPTEGEILKMIEKAANTDDLAVAADLINSIADNAVQHRLNAAFDARADAIR